MEGEEGGSEGRGSEKVAANHPRIEVESPSQKHQQHGRGSRQSSRPEPQPENQSVVAVHTRVEGHWVKCSIAAGLILKYLS